LLLVLKQGRKGRGRNVNEPLFRLFWRIANDHVSDFCVESILTKEMVEKLYHSDLFPDILKCLRQLPSPIISDKLWEQISSSTQLGAAFFSLLPQPLLDDSFLSVFQFFVDHVTSTTCRFWTLWLREKVLYIGNSFPIALAPDPQRDTHASSLCQSFTSLLFQCTDLESERTRIFVNCWSILCQNSSIVSAAIAHVLDCLKSEDHRLFAPITVDYLHPILTALAPVDRFDSIRDAFLSFPSDAADFDFDHYVRAAGAVCVLSFARVRGKESSGSRPFGPTADRILSWLPRLLRTQSPATAFAIDVFNYITAQASERIPVFVRVFRQEIAPKIQAVPAEVRRFLLESEPAAATALPPGPLFADFKKPVVEPQPSIPAPQKTPTDDDDHDIFSIFFN
jgi:hypothetical protein